MLKQQHYKHKTMLKSNQEAESGLSIFVSTVTWVVGLLVFVSKVWAIEPWICDHCCQNGALSFLATVRSHLNMIPWLEERQMTFSLLVIF